MVAVPSELYLARKVSTMPMLSNVIPSTVKASYTYPNCHMFPLESTLTSVETSWPIPPAFLTKIIAPVEELSFAMYTSSSVLVTVVPSKSVVPV